MIIQYQPNYNLQILLLLSLKLIIPKLDLDFHGLFLSVELSMCLHLYNPFVLNKIINYKLKNTIVKNNFYELSIIKLLIKQY